MVNFKNRKCIYCENEFTPKTGNQKTCGSEECRKKLNRKLGLDAYYRNRELAEKKKKKIITVKKESVCRGCKYHQKISGTMSIPNLCRYMDMTGRSRLKVEYDNGGYKEDSCVCYEKGKAHRGRSKMH